MKIRTDFVTNSSSSSYCVSLLVKPTDGDAIKLDLWPEWSDGSTDVTISFRDEIKDVLEKAKKCKTVNELKELLASQPVAEDDDSLQEEIDSKIKVFRDELSKVDSIEDIEKIVIREYFYAWGEYVYESMEDFAERADLDPDEVEDMDDGGTFDQSIYTTLVMATGEIEKDTFYENEEDWEDYGDPDE